MSRLSVLADVNEERYQQANKWGPQHHPDQLPGSKLAGHSFKYLADAYKQSNDSDEAKAPEFTNWTNILLEEVFEALSEHDIAMLRKELVQVAAVAVAWIEDIDYRLNLEEFEALLHGSGGHRDVCSCRSDTELGSASVCSVCGHRDHGRGGCLADGGEA